MKLVCFDGRAKCKLGGKYHLKGELYVQGLNFEGQVSIYFPEIMFYKKVSLLFIYLR